MMAKKIQKQIISLFSCMKNFLDKQFFPVFTLFISYSFEFYFLIFNFHFIFFQQISNGNTKEKDAALKSLNAHLGRNQGFLCSGRLTLADIAVLAAILGARSNFKTLPKNAKVWFQTMSSSFDLKNFNVPSTWTSSQEKKK